MSLNTAKLRSLKDKLADEEAALAAELEAVHKDKLKAEKSAKKSKDED